MKRIVLGFGLVLVGCGSSNSATDARIDDARVFKDAPGSGFVLTSTAFAAGGTIPTDNSCHGANTSPALAWTGAPSTTLSLAMVLTDQSLTPPLIHWVIYDMPPATTMLPAHVDNVYAPSAPPGAHQTESQAGPASGYAGPCPPAKGAAHNYQFEIFALDVATLPGGSAQTMANEALASIETHKLASATLTGMYMSP